MSDGTLRDFPNIPASATVDVDGKQLSVSELQPGMKLQRATVTTTTPQVVTTVRDGYRQSLAREPTALSSSHWRITRINISKFPMGRSSW